MHSLKYLLLILNPPFTRKTVCLKMKTSLERNTYHNGEEITILKIERK